MLYPKVSTVICLQDIITHIFQWGPRTQLKLTIELIYFVLSVNIFLSLYPLITSLLILALYLTKNCLLKKKILSHNSLNVLLYFSSFISFYLTTNSDIITSHLNFWDNFLTNLTALSHSSFQFIVNSWINLPDTHRYQLAKMWRLIFMFCRRDVISYLNNSLINFALMNYNLPF